MDSEERRFWGRTPRWNPPDGLFIARRGESLADRGRKRPALFIAVTTIAVAAIAGFTHRWAAGAIILGGLVGLLSGGLGITFATGSDDENDQPPHQPSN